MKRRSVFVGDTAVKVNEAPVEGAFVELDGERFYKISNVDRMPDFFMTLVSASDQWMYISSNGSLTAGRKNSENALFPYYSEDTRLRWNNRKPDPDAGHGGRKGEAVGTLHRTSGQL